MVTGQIFDELKAFKNFFGISDLLIFLEYCEFELRLKMLKKIGLGSLAHFKVDMKHGKLELMMLLMIETLN